MLPQFARYIGIDYSGAQTATSSLQGLRLYSADRGDDPREIPPPAGARKYWTRRGIAEWLVEELASDTPTIVGIDHAFSFPEQYFRKHQLPLDWNAFLEDFCRHWPTDNDHVYVDFVRDGNCGNGAAREGNSRWRRRTEELSGSAKSVFQFDCQGSVAKSTHSGIPWLRYIRHQARKPIHFWPFDGWEVPPGHSAIVEVYPRLWSRQFPAGDRTGDQHDAYSVAAWLRSADVRGALLTALNGPASASDRELAAAEGWILGIESNDERRSRNPPPRAPEAPAFASAERPIGASVSTGLDAIHLALLSAAHAIRNGQSDLAAIARWAVGVAEGAGYQSQDDRRVTRFTGMGITRFQTWLYAMNERSDWRFPDSVLLIGWLLECGGPAMGRGPARADFTANGVPLMIGGSRWRYNNRRYGHGGQDLRQSQEYNPADCPHMGRGAT